MGSREGSGIAQGLTRTSERKSREQISFPVVIVVICFLMTTFCCLVVAHGFPTSSLLVESFPALPTIVSLRRLIQTLSLTYHCPSRLISLPLLGFKS